MGTADESREEHGRAALMELLRARAERSPSAPALIAPGRAPLTYAQLVQQMDDTVSRLNALGFGRGSRVAMVLPDSVEMAAAFLCISAGATCMPLNPAFRTRELELAFAHANPHALLVLAGSASPAVAVARRLAIPVLELMPAAEEGGRFTLRGLGASQPVTGGAARADDAILVLQTSGTSAEPKLVTLTHRNVVAAARAICDALELTAADRCLSVLPLFHIHGLSAIVASLVAGGSVVCPPGFSAHAFFASLDELRPTWYTASPAIHRAIVEEARRGRHRAAGSSLRFIRSASSAMPRELAIELEELFQVPLIEAYGMTEAAPQIASNRLPPHVRKPGSVGTAAGPEIAIVDGEIAIRGENVSSPGWLRTGDLGYLDADGHLFVTGRVTDVINRGGEKIAPQEVESALLDHPGVAEAAAFGLPHPTVGHRVAAAVVLRAGAEVNAGALRRFVAERLASFKVPQPSAI
ncbi:MAG TPA: AMP-binding protein, partial [Thermoanaerobaculia bacterium]